jgi:hypothetical protein
LKKRPLLILLCTAGLGASLGLIGPTANADPTAFVPPAVPRARVVDLDGHARVQVTPVGATGRSVVAPLASGGDPAGVYVTQTSSGTTIQSVAGGAPTLVEGSRPTDAKETAADDTVELHLAAVARDGRDAVAKVTLMNLATGEARTRELPADPGSTCTTAGYEYSDCVLVPPGDYSVMAFVTTMPAGAPITGNGRTVQNVALVGNPEVHISGARDFVFDARDARRVTVATPDHPTKTDTQGTVELFYRRTAANGEEVLSSYYPGFMLDNHFYEQPSEGRVSIGSLETMTRVRLVKPDITLDAPRTKALHPSYYDPLWFSDLASEYPMYDGRARLRAVDVGKARPQDLKGRHLHGAIAVVERSGQLSVAEQSNAAAKAGAEVVAIYNDGPGDSDDPNGLGSRLRVPTVRLDHAEGRSLARLPRGARVTIHGEPASPYLYDLLIKEHGRIPRDLHYTFRTRDLATQVRQLHAQPGGGASTFADAAYDFQPGQDVAFNNSQPFRGGPRERTEYRIPDQDTRWNYAVWTPAPLYSLQFPHPPLFPMGLTSPRFTTYHPRDRELMPVGTAPIVSAPNPRLPIARVGDRLQIVVDGFTDADGNHGLALTDIDGSGLSTHLTVQADGQTVFEDDFIPARIVDVPAGDSLATIRFTVDNAESWNRLSTHTDTSWSFPTSTAPEEAPVTQPVLVPDYDVPVDLHNRLAVNRHGHGELDLAVRHQADSSASPVGDVTLDASWDDGQTWVPATLTRAGSRWHVLLPKGTGFVSLRLHAADDAGSSVDQTTVRAFQVR